MPETSAERPVGDVVQVRRAPKYGVFAALGTGVGLIAALVLSTVFDGTDEASPFTQTVYSSTQAFGFIALWCIPAGILLGMIVALILDSTVGRRTRDIRAAHEVVDEAPAEG